MHIVGWDEQVEENQEEEKKEYSHFPETCHNKEARKVVDSAEQILHREGNSNSSLDSPLSLNRKDRKEEGIYRSEREISKT